MPVDLTSKDRFVEYAGTIVAQATPERAVVDQPAADFLDNHVGVRHASALFTAGHEASRALVRMALGDAADAVRAELLESEVSYVNVGFGRIESSAEPAGEGWEDARAAIEAGRAVELAVDVTGTDEKGKVVVTVAERWRLAPAS
jgi:hypothetical protein